jgi:hypothetical protein
VGILMSVAGTCYKVQLGYPLIPLCPSDEIHTVQLEVISDVHIYQSQTPSKTTVCTTFVTRY